MNSVTGVASKPEIVIFEKIPGVAFDCSHGAFALHDEEGLVKIHFLRFLCRDVKQCIEDNLLFGYFVDSGNVAVVQCGDFDFGFDIC